MTLNKSLLIKIALAVYIVEQFRAHRKTTGIKHHVIEADKK
jgi:hypothetical protein